MNVSLTPALEKFVQNKVKKGGYQSASEVVREALRVMGEAEKMEAIERASIRRKIELGYQQAVRGELLDGDEVFDAIEKQLAKRAREIKKSGKGRRRAA